MKKSTVVVGLIVILVIAGIVVSGRSSDNNADNNQNNGTSTPQKSAPVSETTKVSSKTSEYQNAELGFSVKYPTGWEADNTDTGVSFIMPIDQTQVSTVAKLQADIVVTPGKCSFPPVTTVKDRGTLAVGNMTLNMISMSNTVQGRGYFNRMYSLEKNNICYMFSFSSITQSATSKKLTGSNLTQATNNNKAIVNSADAAFMDMVKSFAFVQGPAGEDETKAAPAQAR